MSNLVEMGKKAKSAAVVLATLPTPVKNKALLASADALMVAKEEILAKNKEDVDAALAILKENGVGGTFFLVGFWIEANEDKVKYIDEAGIDIGTHSNTHPKMSSLSASQMNQELKTSMDMITKITGKEVKYFRPPFGDYND